jgi:hypothetical protein
MKKSKLIKSHMLRVRISEYEAVKLSWYADKQNKTVSQIIREYLRRLPAIKMNFEEFSEYYEATTGIKNVETNLNRGYANSLTLSLEDWLKMTRNQNEIPLDEWSEIANW